MLFRSRPLLQRRVIKSMADISVCKQEECSCSCSCSSSWCHTCLHAPKAVLFFFFFCLGGISNWLLICVCERECVMVICQTAIFSYHFTSLWSICVCFPGLEQLYCSLWKPAHPFLVTLSTSLWNKNKVATQSVVSGQMEAAKAPKLANKKPRVQVVLSSTAFHFFYFHIRIQHLLRFFAVLFPFQVEKMWKLPYFWHSYLQIANCLSAL